MCSGPGPLKPSEFCMYSCENTAFVLKKDAKLLRSAKTEGRVFFVLRQYTMRHPVLKLY